MRTSCSSTWPVKEANMNLDTLVYYTNILKKDVENFNDACVPPSDITDQDFRRALNAILDSIKADTANLQYLIDG